MNEMNEYTITVRPDGSIALYGPDRYLDDGAQRVTIGEGIDDLPRMILCARAEAEADVADGRTYIPHYDLR